MILKNRYELLDRLEAGPLASLYSALDHLKDKRRVLFRTLRPPLAGEETLVHCQSTFRRVAQLQSPLLVEIHDFGVLAIDPTTEGGKGEVQPGADEAFYVAFEESPGKDLFEATRNVAPEGWIRWILDLCVALEVVHARGWVHLDLRPGNVRVLEAAAPRTDSEVGAPRIRLGGLGVHSLPFRHRVVIANPDPEYQTPEEVLGRPVDHRTDVYQLGCLLFQVLARRPPFRSPDPEDVRRMHVGRAPQFPPRKKAEIEDALAEIVLRCLAKDPADRYRRVADLAADLAATIHVPAPVVVPARLPLAYPSLVGRTEAIDRVAAFLDHFLHEPEARSRRFVAVRGPTGSGRSRFLARLRDWWLERQGAFHTGDCLAREGQILAPFRAVVEGLIAPDEADAARSVLPSIGRVLTTVASTLEGDLLTPLPPHEERYRVFGGLARLFGRLAEKRPTAVAFDHLDAADEATIDAVPYLLARGSAPGLPLLFLAAYDPERLPKPAAAWLRQLEADGALLAVDLDPLPATEVSKLVSALLGMKNAPKVFGKRVHETTGGNPLFVDHTIRSLVETRRLFHEDGGWKIDAPDPGRMDLPATLDEVLSSRIASQSPAARDLLEALAASRRDLALSLIAQILGRPAIEVLETASSLTEAALVSSWRDGASIEFAIESAAARRLVLERLSGARIKELDAAIEAAYLQSKDLRFDRIAPEDLAAHTTRPHYLVRAARIARSVGEWGPARRLAEKALAGLDESDREKRISVSNFLGECLEEAGDHEAALAAYERSMSWSKRQDLERDEIPLVQAFLGVARVRARTEGADRGAAILDDALKLFEDRESHLSRGRILFAKGLLFARAGDHDKAAPLFGEGLALVDKSGSDAVRVEAFWQGVSSPDFHENLRQPLPHLERGIEICRAEGSVLGVARIRRAMGEVLLRQGKFRRASEEFGRSAGLHAEIGDLAGRAVDLYRLFEAHLATGNLTAARETIDPLGDAASGLPAPYRVLVDAARGQYGMAKGEDEVARTALERAAAAREAAGFDPLFARLLLVELHRRHGRPDEAESGLEAIDPIRLERARWPVRTRYWLERARCAQTPEDLAGLVDPLERALAEAERFEGRSLTWRLEYVLALAREQAGEVERALGHAQTADRLLVDLARGLPEDQREAFLETSGRRDVRRTLKALQSRVGSTRRSRSGESSVIGLATGNRTGTSPARRTADPDDSMSDVENVVHEYHEEIKTLNFNLIREEVHHLRQLLEVNKVLNSEHDVGNLLEVILDTAIELTGAERGFLILSDNGQVEFKIARNYEREEIPRPELRISRSIVERTIATSQAVMTTNAQDDQRFDKFSSVSDLKLHSVLCVPLRAKERVIGAIYMDNRFEQGVFTKKERNLLDAFADQAALALENARLIGDNKKKQEELIRSKERIESLNVRLADINEQLKRKVQNQSIELSEVRGELKEKQEELEGRYAYKNIIGKSKPMQELFALLDRVTDSNVPVFIHGESGTGKELVAKAIHFNGPRRRQRFAVENCAAMTETLLESELFGYMKGAFTGADKDKPGLFEIATGGTMFFDEVGDMSPGMQSKLLRVLQEGEIRRVGGKDLIKVDVRVISASNKDLKTLVEEGAFRADLYYRLNVITLRLPPLRDRREDIPLLVDHLLDEFARETGTPKRAVSKTGIEVLIGHPWPGNIRELHNVITSALSLCDQTTLEGDDLIKALPKRAADPSRSVWDEELSIDDYTQRFVMNFQHKYNDTEMARILGISRKTLWEKRKKWDIVRKS